MEWIEREYEVNISADELMKIDIQMKNQMEYYDDIIILTIDYDATSGKAKIKDKIKKNETNNR